MIKSHLLGLARPVIPPTLIRTMLMRQRSFDVARLGLIDRGSISPLLTLMLLLYTWQYRALEGRAIAVLVSRCLCPIAATRGRHVC